ncbi:helix-turn-helix domain-containing protein [Poriferisphaera sp. WC338]|uniref:helix-turn-helix domain-containing protein n=1 Tax=Poriferisphaera sp. WC338 TaxID=3425129 RepID=UPI003D81C33F
MKIKRSIAQFDSNVDMLDPESLRFIFAGRYRSSRDVQSHAHSFHELLTILEGDCEILMEDRKYYCSVGQAILIPARTPHFQSSTHTVATAYMGFDCLDANFDITPRLINLHSDELISTWIQTLAQLYQQPNALAPAVASGLLTAILGRLNQLEHTTEHSSGKHPKLILAMQWIEDNMLEKIYVDQIAEQAGLSASHLTSMFRQELRLSPIAYQIQLRMELACKYLREPYLSVKEISQQCGYSDTNLFVRLFRKKCGLSPGKWRQQYFEDHPTHS